ncbi:HamA C-terminal domain-containing protein [Methylobacterium brachiatum]|uniref:HamA C-terminal domain-containing protein n=1 Tax=Methylobacterium brachiatum TaxID=269660 RepID=UPI0008E986D6|nr:DUF1837 domain-containing protein [Methylobacterium brachiatum]SFI05908.1 protein of unknown function [Methylobacterium brachiatum]
MREASLSTINASVLEAAVTGNPEALEVHLAIVERDILIEGHTVKIHCHCLAVDGNGRIQLRRLAEFMRNAAVDYALPRSKVAEAKARDAKFNSTEAIAELVERAKRSFTDLAKTGEGGEMLLFMLAERFLRLPQILCKMDLKTDDRLHYHGADGVYAGVTVEGVLKLYWGESKVYDDAGDAIRSCLASLAPYLIEPEHEGAERERDLLLLSDKADLSEPILTEALKKYFDKSSKQSNRVRYCGLALVGFKAPFYPESNAQAVAEEIAGAAREALVDWREKIGKGLTANRLEDLEIEFFCVPLPSAQGFRDAFLEAMGLKV